MSSRYWTSDDHWFHQNILKPDYADRPYQTVGEMNEDLIAKWNAKIPPEAVVMHLGDFSLQNRYVPEILPRLNGEITLIVGNHDRCWDAITKPHKVGQAHWKQQYLDWGFKNIYLNGLTMIGPYKVTFSHLPLKNSGDHTPTERYSQYRLDPQEGQDCHLHGHRHSSPGEKIRKLSSVLEIDVGVDGNYMEPYSEEELEELIRNNV